MPPVLFVPPLAPDPSALLVPPEPESLPFPLEVPLELDAHDAAPTTISARRNTDRRVDFMETSVECERVKASSVFSFVAACAESRRRRCRHAQPTILDPSRVSANAVICGGTPDGPAKRRIVLWG
jgi:hypothetical protein